MLIAIGYETLGYISKLEEKVRLPFETLASVPKQKQMLRFDKIITLDKKENVLDVKFHSKELAQKGEPEVWTMRMAS